MATLIGLYENPDINRIEQDDEARRTLIEVQEEGGQILGGFNSDATDDDIEGFCSAISQYVIRKRRQ